MKDLEILKEMLLSHKTVRDMGYITPCWIFATVSLKYYGRIQHKYIDYDAHVLAAELWLPNFNKSLLTLHKCDIRPCFNPDHLFQGTHSDNSRDMTAKGRHPKKKKTHCWRGHEFTPENTRMSGCHRCCRRCDKINNDAKSIPRMRFS